MSVFYDGNAHAPELLSLDLETHLERRVGITNNFEKSNGFTKVLRSDTRFLRALAWALSFQAGRCLLQSFDGRSELTPSLFGNVVLDPGLRRRPGADTKVLGRKLICL